MLKMTKNNVFNKIKRITYLVSINNASHFPAETSLKEAFG